MATDFEELGNWALGSPGAPVFHPWSFKPTDIQVQGPETWGYDAITGMPVFTAPSITDVAKARAYLTNDNRIVETKAGDVSSIPSITLSEQTVWFLPVPPNFHPVRLIAIGQTLVEGTGFIVAGNWVMFYHNPQELWPDGVIAGWCVRVAPSWKSTTLRADNLFSSGREVALYKRNSQNLLQFEKAVCEVAGLPVLDREGLVVRMETGGNQVIHWLEDGRSFTLPVSSPYTEGSVVPAGSGHVLRLLHISLQGADWWRGRPWSA